MPSYAEVIRKAALWYAKQGIKVFQVDTTTKRPFDEGGFYNATTDPHKIEGWFDLRPNAGLAMPTGVANGCFVLDIDDRNGGFATLKSMLEDNTALPSTPTAFTQNGGLHYYFAYPPFELRTTKIPGGIDIKSDGGYVLVPPSMSPDGRSYRWEPGKDMGDLTLPQAPEWLFDYLRRERTREEESWDVTTLVYPEGTRENNLLRLMGWLIRKGASYEAIHAFASAENTQRCRPPLTEGELDRLVGSVTGRYVTTPEDVLGVNPAKLTPKGWGRPADLKGVLSTSAGQVDELVEGIIGKGTVTILAAAWKSGKTLVTYRMILDTLQGNPVWGVFPTSKPLKILMLQFEMPVAEDERRFRRLAIGSGLSPNDFVKSVGKNYIHFSRPSSSLSSIEHAQDFRRYVLAEDFDLVVIDSLTAAFAGQDLNDNSLARLLFSQAFTQITTAGKSVLILHHKRKKSQIPGLDDSKGAVLGAQAWGAAADRTFSLDNVPPTMGETFTPGEFRVRLEVLGSWAPTDLNGLTIVIRDDGDGTVLEPVDASPVTDSDPRLEDCIRDLCDFVVAKVETFAGEVHKHLQIQGYPRKIRNHAKAVAITRGWVAEHMKGFEDKKTYLIKGPNWLK